MALPDGPLSPAIVQTARFLTRPFPLLDECARRYGGVFRLRLLGTHDVVMLSEPELIRRVYTADEEALSIEGGRRFLEQIVGPSSVLVLDGAAHMRKRRLLLPPFHGERMHAYARIIRDVTEASIEGWPLGRAFRLHPRMQGITLRIILRAVFGIEGGARHQRLLAQLTELMDEASSPLLLVAGLLGKNVLDAAPWLRVSRLKADVDALIYAEIAERRASGAPREDVLSLLLSARDEEGRPLSDAELRDELLTVLVAGHETTATALAWTFGLALRRPDVLAKIGEELERHAGRGPLEPEALPKLDYIDAVVKESLRLFPVVPVVSRITARPFPLGDITIPAGARLSTCIYLTHRRPDLYPDPERFMPERFLGRKIDPYTWFPFGGGLRRCIGMAFALYELKAVLATVLLRARLSPASPSLSRPVRRTVTVAPADGAPVVLERRLPRAPPP